MDKNNTIEKRGFKMAFDSFTERNCMGFGCASYDGLRISMMDDAIIIHLKFQKPEIVAIGIKYTTDDNCKIWRHFWHFLTTDWLYLLGTSQHICHCS